MTLVIEWDEVSDAATMVSVKEPTGPSPSPLMMHSAVRTIVTVVGALAALAFATWGIRHLRAS